MGPRRYFAGTPGPGSDGAPVSRVRTRDLGPSGAGRPALPGPVFVQHDRTMTRPLDVLVLESRRGGARFVADELEANGHHVHRCHEPGDPSFPCRGVSDPSDCPLDGPMDAALLVRQHTGPDPSFLEAGVACAIRAGIPVVEDGSTVLDAYAPWVTARVVGGAVVAGCHQAVARAYEPVIADVLRRCSPLFDATGIDPSKVTCRIELVWPRLHVCLDVPGSVSKGVREALAVRALDAVHSGRRSYDTVNVHVNEVPS